MNQRRRPSRDEGVTLIELLVVMLIVGLVIVAISTAFIVIVRTAPGTEARADDSRSLLGVTTFLPEDVNSTPPDGFLIPDDPENLADRTVTAGEAGCLGATTENLVQMTWAEFSTTYRASYRYEPSGDGRAIVRHSCTEGSGTTSSVTLTSELPASFAAVDVTPVADSFGREIGLELEVTSVDGKLLTVDAQSNNPAVFLPPIVVGVFPPVPVGNTGPVALPVVSNTEAGVARNVYLNGKDADGDILVASVLGNPSGWNVDVTGNGCGQQQE